MKAIEFTRLEPMPGPAIVTGLPHRVFTGPPRTLYPVRLVWGRRWKSRLRLRDGLEFGTIDLGGEA